MFFYFVKITPETSGKQTVSITQKTKYESTSGTPYFTLSIVPGGPAATVFKAPYNYLYTFSTLGVAGSTKTLTLNHK